jgi:alkylation response protein AidB-like acyl-CoA dehydrogenase
VIVAGTATQAPRFGLSPALKALQRDARAFALDRVRPRALEREWAADPADRVDWELVEEASARGWRTMGLPVEDGGQGADALALCVLIEELAYGDMGFAVIMDQTLKIQKILSRLATGSIRRRWLDGFLADPRAVLAICFTEPETSSDYIIGHPGFRFRTTARRDADGNWVLNGYKRYISNGADASYYVVFACTDPDRPANAGTSAFLLEPGLPGFEVVQVHEKISQRTINNGALRFTDVVLEPERMLGDVHAGYTDARDILRESAIEAGATTLGTARAAYELAVDHARTRVQGGAPLIEHANVGCRLAEMCFELEAARSLIWRAAWAVSHDPEYDHKLGSAAKTFAAEAAVRVCTSAMELFGGMAIMMDDSMIQKCMRDCLSFLHSDGAQDSHRLRVAGLIREDGA